MELMETIYNRRSVRFYTEETVDKDTIEELIKAGIQAPSAMNVQPWAFAVIQDKELLQKISDETKVCLLASLSERPYLECYRQLFSDPEFHVFYNAPALIITLAKPEGAYASGDCTLAAQNIMLAAHSLGLGSCWIGFAQMSLNTPELKEQLGIPKEYTIVAPLIIGHPAKASVAVIKKEPEILFWK